MAKGNVIYNAKGEALDVVFHGSSRADAIIVIGHGLTANKDRNLLLAIANGLSRRGWPCIRFSFSGNGESEGRFEDSTISKEVEDLSSVLATIPQHKRVAYIGHSMGAAVGLIRAARNLDIHCLVSLAGMTHTADFVRREFGDIVPGEGVMWEREDCPLSQEFVDDMIETGSTLGAVSRILQPWLLIHGREDDVVPIADSKDAFAEATCEKKFLKVSEAGHMFGEEYYEVIIEMIDAWLGRWFG
ncbi:MAG: alpha/beta hydrolase [Luteolibacter sp.]